MWIVVLILRSVLHLLLVHLLEVVLDLLGIPELAWHHDSLALRNTANLAAHHDGLAHLLRLLVLTRHHLLLGLLILALGLLTRRHVTLLLSYFEVVLVVRVL